MNPDDAVPGEVLKSDERTRRILDAAVQLAEAGGFAAVRLRDVAQTSGVALGTVYKRFRSKEDLLLGVLTHELHDLRAQLTEQPVLGPTPLLRVIGFFRFLTEFLCRRPNLARAVVRSAASGEQALSERLSRFHAKLFELSFAAWQGGPHRAPTSGETVMLSALQQVWFSALCGWAGSLYDRAEVVNQVAAAASLMTHGVDHVPTELTAVARPLRVLVRAIDGSARASELGLAPLQLAEAAVEFVVADPGASLQELLAQADVVHLVGQGPPEDVAWLVAGEASSLAGGRPRVIVLAGGYEAGLAARLISQVDAVIGVGAGLGAEQSKLLAEKLYLALARGWSLQDSYDDAREAVGVEIGIAGRVGADLRALSLR